MGTGMSTELGGAKCLLEENREELELIKQRIFSNDPTLTDVDLANRYITDRGINEHITCIAANTNMTRLDLSYNGLTAASMPTLLAAVKQCKQLKVLDLAGNRIGEEGCKLLGDYLMRNPQLEELYVFHNDLYDKSIVPFANALLFNRNLAVLNTDQNNLTNASWVMLHKAICSGASDASGMTSSNGNKSLIKLKVGTRADIVPCESIVDEINLQLGKNKVGYDAKKAEEAADREAAEAEKTREIEAEKHRQIEIAEDAARAQAHEEALERQRREEEVEMRAYEAAAAQQQKGSSKKSKEQLQAENEMWVARAMDQAYDWRRKLTQNGTMVKEWKDGFTTLCTQPGDEVGAKPSAAIGAPRRLQACWCDPHDVSVPYAKTLHYHCKHEDLNRPLQDGQVPKYEGCHATGHVCASVGFYAKPKPDLSAAHFFSSPQRAAREEGNDVYEEGNMTNMSAYNRSHGAASVGTAAPSNY